MLQRVMLRFYVENFLSHNAETFGRGTLLCCVSEKFCQRKCLWIRGRGKYQDFPSKLLCLAVPKKFVGQPFSVLLTSGIEKVYASEGFVTTFRRISLSRSAETFRRGTHLCCVSEISW